MAFSFGMSLMFVVWTCFLFSMTVSTSDLSMKTECFHLTLGYRDVVSSTFTDNNHSDRVTSHWRCYCYEGQRQAFYLLWSNPVITIKFANSMIPKHFIMIYGNSEEAIWKNTLNPFINFINDLDLFRSTDREEISLRAFSESCVAVKTDSSYRVTFNVENIALWIVAYLVAGIGIFFGAKNLSRNRYLHYSTGAAIGVMASIVLLLLFLRRHFEQSLPTASFIMIAAAISSPFRFWTYFMNQAFEPITSTLIQYWQYILGYVIVTGLISFCACYRYGPVTDTRSLNLIQWFIQLVSLILINQGTQIPELSVAIIVVLLTLYNIPKGFYRNRFTYYLRFKFFTPKHKFLTEKEYIKQGKKETKKALEELRSFCQSPQCDTWKVVSHLSTPLKFAMFVEGDSWHVTDQELLEYDSGPEPTPPVDPDSSDEDEMDFILSSP